MKNLDFFQCLDSVKASCIFNSLPSSYFWNTRTMWFYTYIVVGEYNGTFLLKVYKQIKLMSVHIYSVRISVGRFVCVSDILYSDDYISHLKFTPDELRKSVPFLLGKFRNYSLFLDKFSLAAKVLDKEFFSCV